MSFSQAPFHYHRKRMQLARALFYIAPSKVELRPVLSQGLTKACDTRVRTQWSGVSRGTERLVFEGRVPVSEAERMRAPFQEGDFPFPVKYGYAAVGRVEEGPSDLLQKNVFCLFPHQESFEVASTALSILPDGLPPKRAILAANMETALNAVWDSGVAPGDRVAIVGAGILGGLLAGLIGAIPGVEACLIDVQNDRAALASHMNVSFRDPANAPDNCDVVFHTSSSENGAATALTCGGLEARIVEMSWFGDAAPALPLGEAFHIKRLTYLSSQVGQVAPSHRARWSYARRMAKALDLLRDQKYDALITREVTFDQLPTTLPEILAPDSSGFATAVRYEE